MQIIDGKKIAAELRNELKARIMELKAKGTEPGLATIIVGDDPASQVYVSSKIKACQELGVRSFSHHLSSTSTEREVTDMIEQLNKDARVHGILLQLPLPKGLDSEKCLRAISPLKDVDGLHPYSLGQLLSAKSWDDIEANKLLVPCTPLGIIFLLKKAGVTLAGKKAIVVGRSNLVGKPVAMLLLANNCTVTMAHSKTANLAEECRSADILIAAIGKPKFIKREFVKPGAAVIDVGINRTKDGLCGDVDFDSAREVAGCITPVPGGVGPMTITMLIRNTIIASQKE